MGSGEVAIVALSTMISLKVTFSDGLGGVNSFAADKITDVAQIVSGQKYYIGATTGGTDSYLSLASTDLSASVKGTAVGNSDDANVFVFEKTDNGWTIGIDGTSYYLSLQNNKDNGKVQIVEEANTFTISNKGNLIHIVKGNFAIQKNNRGTQFGSYASTQTDVWLMPVASNKTLTSLSISGEPTKKVYNAGEALDPTGLVVTGTYDDATTAKISSGITWTMNPETLSADNTTCTVTATVGGVTSGSYEVTGLTVKPKEVVGENRWVKTTLSDLLPTDQVVIVDVTSKCAMSNDKGTSDAPTAVSVTLDGDALTGTVAENCVWNVTKNSDNTYTFFPNGTTEKWLYTIKDNNGVRVGTSENNCFEEYSDGSYNGLKNTATSRYVGVYNKQDWRCYTSVNQNIENTSIAYYKYASNKTATKIVFEKGDATYDQGTENPLYENAAKVTTADGTEVAGATVTYASSDDIHAVVDEKGAVLVDATVPGTYTITASFAGDDTYASAKATYTITVNKVLTGEGTLEKPYTVADVIAIVNDGAQTKNPVYVKGIVSKVVSSANNIEQYKNCDYFIVDEEGSSASVEAFRGKYLGNTDFTSLAQIAAGDKVILCGVMTKYNDIVELDRGNYIAKFWDIEELVLDEKADNNTIEAKRHATVYMDRTFNANAWNTLVLPFDMTAEQVTATFGADTKLANYMGTTMNEDGTYTLNFRTTDVITANTPVFVYGAKNVDTQTVEDVNVVVGDPVATPASAAFAFQGSYGKMQVNAGDWFISSDNNFYRAKGTESMKATRALFRATTAEAAAKGLTISIDGEATAIQGIVTDKADSDAPAYNLAGQRVADNYRGIIIKGGKKYLNK